MTNNNFIIDLNSVSIKQAEKTVLSNVNLRVSTGEFIYLIGKVGSGKTSLIKVLYADLGIASGKASVAGYYLPLIRRKQIPFLRRKIGVVFQDFQLLEDRTVYMNLEFVLKATGWKKKDTIETRIKEVLTKVDMLDNYHKMPHELSGGEKQRVVIARALLNSPDIILADEPTGNLDPETSEDLMSLLVDISKSGKTVIMATHQHDLIEKFPNKVYECYDGELIESNMVESYL
ncbi:MAG: ATP-binding cassette domain-containing protein [Marinifilaceae bacterium]|jgi:cell division transport system ATP-binding protein|nr:ATP-binding cassette domain-containing protein [Marinifilaceae bacterium]